MKKASILIPAALLTGVLGAGFFYLHIKLRPHMARGAELAPAETLFFAQLPDLARSRDRWMETSLAGLWREPEMQVFMEKPLAKLAGDSVWQKRFEHLIRLRPREMFVAVTSIDGAMPQFVAGLCFSGGKSQVEALLAEPRAALRKAWPAGKADLISYGASEIEIFSNKENVMAGCFAGDWYFAASNLELLERTLDRHALKSGERPSGNGEKLGANLANSPLFAAAVARLPASSDGLVFAQLGTIMDRVTGLMAAGGQKLDDSQLAALRKTQAIAASTKMEGKQFRDTVFVLSPGSAAAGEALQRHSLALTSPDTVIYHAMGLPAGIELPDSLILPGTAWLPALESMKKRLAEKGLVLSDFGKAFGPEFGTVVDWPEEESQPSFLLALDVRDPLKAKAFVEVLTGDAEELVWSKKEQDGAAIYLAQASEALPLFAPAVALTEHFLLLGLSEESLEPVLQRLKAGVPAVSTTPKFQVAARSVAAASNSFGYADLGVLCQRAYGMFRPFVVMSMTLAPEAGEYIDAGKLPSTETLLKHLGPMAFSQSTSDEGVLFESAGTLTFSQVLAGGLAGAITAVLPNLNKLSADGIFSGSDLLQLKPSNPLLPANPKSAPDLAPEEEPPEETKAAQ